LRRGFVVWGWTDTSLRFATTKSIGQCCRKLTADDLKDIGVTAVGHRRKLLEAIAQLSATDMPPDAVPPIAPRRSGGRTSFVRLKKASSEPYRRLH
jgi:hypothetical protein